MVPGSPSGPDRGDLFAAGGEAGRLMAALDWAATPVGPVESLAGRPALRRPHRARVEVPHGADLGAGVPPVLQRRLRALHRREAPGHRRGHPRHAGRGLGRARPADRARHDDPRGVLAARPAAAARARRVPRGDLLHRLPRPRLRRRRRGRRHARGLHRDDRPDPRRAPAAPAPRPVHRRRPARATSGRRSRRCARALAGDALDLPFAAVYLSVPGEQGFRRVAAVGCDPDLLPDVAGRGRAGRGRGPAGRDRGALRRPRHRGRRPAAHRHPGRRAARPAARGEEPQPGAGRGVPVLLRARGRAVRRARSSTSARSRPSGCARSPSPSSTARRPPSSPTSATSCGRR